MNINRLLIFIAILLFSTISYAQIGDTIITHDKGKVHKFTGMKYFPILLRDYDSQDNNWLGFWTNISDHKLLIRKVDNDLNVLDSLETINYLSIKYNNKFYGIDMSNFLCEKTTYFDTIALFCADVNANLLYKKVLSTFGSDTIKYMFMRNPRVFFTKDKNFGIFKKWVDYHYSYCKFILYDTLGNTINSKLLRLDGMYSDADIIETNNNFELHCNFSDVHRDSVETKIYLLNKNTLGIYDSIKGFDSIIRPTNVFNINDSIFLTFGIYKMSYDGTRFPSEHKIRIVNRNTKKIKTLNFILDMESGVSDLDYYPEFASRFDYINTDSMYMVAFSPDVRVSGGVTRPENSVSNKIKIINFNINGVLNYEYDFDFDTTKWKQITGVKATSDGGLIISYLELDLEDSYIIKFKPNGFVGLTEVSTGKKEGLRVYPNPAKDFVLVDIEADRFVEADIEIYDLGGRMVKSSKLSAKVGNRIDVSDLKAGVYSYRVVLNGKGVSGKIVVGE